MLRPLRMNCKRKREEKLYLKRTKEFINILYFWMAHIIDRVGVQSVFHLLKKKKKCNANATTLEDKPGDVIRNAKKEENE